MTSLMLTGSLYPPVVTVDWGALSPAFSVQAASAKIPTVSKRLIELSLFLPVDSNPRVSAYSTLIMPNRATLCFWRYLTKNQVGFRTTT
jgi:hypothetical protein